MNTPIAISRPHRLPDITWLVAGAIALCTLAAGASLLHSVDAPKYQDPQCASLARAMVNRSHSMLEGNASRAVVQQAYQECQNDPQRFRNLLR